MIKLKPNKGCNKIIDINAPNCCERFLCRSCAIEDRDRYKELFDFLNESLNLVLCGEDIPDGITTAKHEIENVYGDDYFEEKDNGVKIVMKKNFKAPDVSTVYRCKFKPKQ